LNRLRTLLAYGFIFLTGATALVYEVIWQRYLTRLTGNDSLATALILGIFLGATLPVVFHELKKECARPAPRLVPSGCATRDF
jgi:hypothetical protein